MMLSSVKKPESRSETTTSIIILFIIAAFDGSSFLVLDCCPKPKKNS
jgi:hypothetical protein